MKLYTGRIRRYRRMLGRSRIEHLDNYVKTLKPGSLINTCRAYNEVIQEIEWEYRHIRNQRYLVNATITATSGLNCALYGCCSPVQSKEDIIKYFTEMGEEEDRRWFADYQSKGWAPGIKWEDTIAGRLLRGEEVFDERGCLIKR